MSNYFIADTHFGHKNVLSFDNRPFKTIEEHDNILINNWNKTVSINDDVYILGDLSWYNSTKTIEIVNQLNRRNLFWIKGNHDNKILKNRELRNLFVEICDYKELDLGNDKILVLSHYPIPCFNKHYYGSYHLFGHVHIGFEHNMMMNIKYQMENLYNKPCNMYNAGCMMPYMDYTPRTLDEIISSNDNLTK